MKTNKRKRGLEKSGQVLQYGSPIQVICPKDGLCWIGFDDVGSGHNLYGWVKVKKHTPELVIEYQEGKVPTRFTVYKVYRSLPKLDGENADEAGLMEPLESSEPALLHVSELPASDGEDF